MWTMVGKKIAGKPRGTTPISMEEIRALIILLKDNLVYHFHIRRMAWILFCIPHIFYFFDHFFLSPTKKHNPQFPFVTYPP